MKASLSVLFYLISATSAHSWAERAMVFNESGLLDGFPGFPRGYGKPNGFSVFINLQRAVFRTSSAFSDPAMTHLLPPNGRENNRIYADDLICKETQLAFNQTLESPPLLASPLSKILLMYQENGHVTQLSTTPGKTSSGEISVYGTATSRPSDTLRSIHDVWTMTGDSDDRGRLLARASFDDGNCYQVSDKPESSRRRQLSQRKHEEFEGNDLWCGIEVTLPADVRRGSMYTLYWVWDWPTQAHLPEFPNGKEEIYTTCLDIQIV